MAWVDTTYLENAIGAGQVTALGLSGAVLTQYEESARATVSSVLLQAGYTPPGDTLTVGAPSTAILQKLCFAVLVRDAYALRKGISLPEASSAVINDAMKLLDAILDKRVRVPGLTANTRDGYGGVISSETSGSNSRQPRMGRNQTGNW